MSAMGSVIRAWADRDIILAAGALATPKLLMRYPASAPHGIWRGMAST